MAVAAVAEEVQEQAGPAELPPSLRMSPQTPLQ